jgi:DNA-nicking Smr family endonuclease
MAGIDDPQDEDAAAFAEAVRDVKPLRPHNLVNVRPPRSSANFHSSARETVFRASNEDGCVAKNGISQNLLRRIRNGQIPVESEIDLHGLTVSQAELQLRSFLNQNRTDRQRLVRIIHGKGHGSPGQQSILRTKVTEWLSESDYVLAFCPGGPLDGGTGAVRVLLKRRT